MWLSNGAVSLSPSPLARAGSLDDCQLRVGCDVGSQSKISGKSRRLKVVVERENDSSRDWWIQRAFWIAGRITFRLPEKFATRVRDRAMRRRSIAAKKMTYSPRPFAKCRRKRLDRSN